MKAVLLTLALCAIIVVLLLDITAGCGMSYVDANGATQWVAKNSECFIIKHH